MKSSHIVFAVFVALAGAGVSADSRIIGVWDSVDANNGALKGSITLEKKGTATLAAEQQPVLKGTWEVPNAGELKLTMGEYGSSVMKYRLQKGKLVLVYDNGNEQTFVKNTASKVKK